jgi:DNA-3-methyladenine glycosylase II
MFAGTIMSDDRQNQRQSVIRPLTERALADAVRMLAGRDADLARVVREHGPPPLWPREPGFATLVLLILEQQVSLASARATFERLRKHVESVEPARLARFDEHDRISAGVTRQKAGYLRALAEAVADGTLNIERIADLPDAAAREHLTRIKGVGAWTSDVYLLMALRRPDVWPVGDLALATAAHAVKRLSDRPSRDQLEELGEAWRPWRAVAARILWHYYLSTARSRAMSTRGSRAAGRKKGDERWAI